jgi:hypothetical protein
MKMCFQKRRKTIRSDKETRTTILGEITIECCLGFKTEKSEEAKTHSTCFSLLSGFVFILEIFFEFFRVKLKFEGKWKNNKGFLCFESAPLIFNEGLFYTSTPSSALSYLRMPLASPALVRVAEPEGWKQK